MESAPRPLDPDPRPPPAAKVSTFPNGTLKKHHHRPVAPPPAAELYRECLKNHAASLGGHAIDGCGEFMPSPAANPLDPTSLKCAACGCHRNFHRRIHQDLMMDEEEMEDSDEEDRRRRESSSSPPAYLSSSAPHMLLALSSGLAGPGPGLGPGTDQVRPGVLPRKRFRTKFSPDQKEKMQELSERLRWRMQKRDEAVVEEFCKEIGVGKGVFKVWMHNNKHNFVPGSSSRRGEIGSSSSGGGGGGGIDGNNSGGGGGNSHVVNGPPCC